MIKHQGLAQLADTVNTSHYPVRRRGQKRQLNPNWVGIAWLEAEALEDTEILQTIEPDARTSAYKMGEGLAVQHSRRAAEMADESVRERPLYVRPMFQVFNDTDERVIVHHGTRVRADKSCADCYDFQYPGRDCPRHPVKRLIRGGPPGYPAYWEEVAATRPPGPIHTCAVAGRGDCAACADQVRPVTAYASQTIDEAINAEPREGMRLSDELRQRLFEQAEIVEADHWRDLVRQYERILNQQMLRGLHEIRPAPAEEEERDVVVESVDQEGRPLRITLHVDNRASYQIEQQQGRLRGYWTPEAG